MSNHIARIPRPFLSTAAGAIALAVALTVTVPQPAAHAGEHPLSRKISDQSKHKSTGEIAIEKKENRSIVVLHSKFSLDGTPDPARRFS